MSGRPSFNIYEKRRLACTGDMEKAATALRVKAARSMAGLSVHELARRALSTRENIEATEAAQVFPSFSLMWVFWRSHQIPQDFFIQGDFHRIPQDVERRLFAELSYVSGKSRFHVSDHRRTD